MYIVSACLAGVNCRYNGKNSENEYIVNLVKKGEALPLCPEQLGGLSTPRCPSEIVTLSDSKKVLTKDGEDLTKSFEIGAKKVLAVAKSLNINKAILKSKSPSCGCSIIYDGSFSGNLIEGNGITTELLLKNNIKVYTENDIKFIPK